MNARRSSTQAWRLSDLLSPHVSVPVERDREISGLCLDSRRAQPGEVFFALAGHDHHGLTHASEAVRRGVAAVVWEPLKGVSPPGLGEEVPYIEAPDLRRYLGQVAARFHGHPSRSMKVVGVTGTDGKTSVSQILAAALDSESAPCGVLGTLGCGRWGELRDPGLTTPDPVTLHRRLAEMGAQGVRQVVMEVSSHALAQSRVAGVDFDLAILTNLGHDHLDYHVTATAYGEAKARLFEWPGLKTAVLNLDDPFGQMLVGRIEDHVQILGYGLRADPGGRDHLHASDLHFGPEGVRCRVHTPWGDGELETRLLGRFNVLNLLAALGALLTLDVTLSDALERLSRSPVIPGRMECFRGSRGPTLVVDYAHTPEALAQALQAARDHCAGRLWCVFGCGGNRDRGKRPLMARAAERHADHVILTSDNPRREDPMAIIEEVSRGFARADAARIEADRDAAIRHAFMQAGSGDMVLIAGKGHETGQTVGTEVRPFSDRQLALALTGGGA
ncbi:UDP-N-acetylmuramoyl-L-alanyl-D-glutamate--2,6-diaminopimelate ligase [Ectothiorhodospira sp. BSL-9]|uniref:UDP-N-acetylmuramoyl-L-alanyl-D-glutamate--2, 6-diaminopimelate ligase n=1 Tax=Ectothiorhodospira sp. BSL-9 TaxID=1442136 RepID=UPI0007B4427B|nr:UDP-N-acetylmuramoyl-L-alanyl-D-glutamate--2,6-diaminopimelate ligase [Ectothiorhodospira sp. BSL-9]ANB01329.1 UDP-N-acetylmuramyl peptide synthase [Ectothiorhodospira sp. BSL-9]TVQ71947.1 MAG: UDP-N-acetylmuramoyl-L-alanyl-D-glutamate--2,6-diaminopimelate ligase [Chromatiaceae bacterium]